MNRELYGCIEAGGTKFVCALANESGLLEERARIPTTTPGETLRAVMEFFDQAAAQRGETIRAFGIASFGPIDRDPRSPEWGTILETPKPGWTGAPIAPAIRDRFGCPVGFDTDVSAAAMAEAAATGCDGLLVYVTVGTGIGGAAVHGGFPLEGLRHSEMGHFYPPRDPRDDSFAGVCPYHGACLEGLAAGPAIRERWQATLSDLPPDHPGHEIEAHYLAHLAITQIASISPHRIAFGGGVLETPGLIERVRAAARRHNANYLLPDEQLDAVIQPSALDGEAGLHGALLLARRAAPIA